ncbi:MAG: hypothetical protein QXN94_00005 [Thermofilaceae archaeon]
MIATLNLPRYYYRKLGNVAPNAPVMGREIGVELGRGIIRLAASEQHGRRAIELTRAVDISLVWWMSATENRQQ